MMYGFKRIVHEFISQKDQRLQFAFFRGIVGIQRDLHVFTIIYKE